MKQSGKYLLLSWLVFIPCVLLFSQAPPGNSINSGLDQMAERSETEVKPFTVRKIYIIGNKKTKEKVILREVPFKVNDQYLLSDLVKKFEDARRQLMNTALFHEVVVALKSFDEYNVDILIDVKERWYLFPIPYFKFVDRNFNQWLVEQNARLNRLNYGIKILYNNATGNNDKLNIWLMNGYTKQISGNYDRLYIDKKMNWGMNVGVAMGKNREINYKTYNNKQLFFKDTNNYVRTFFRSYAELTYRRAIRTRHRFGIGYVQERVTDTIISLNPGYFKNGRDKMIFPELYYTMTYADADYTPYPLKGYLAEISLVKRGFDKVTNLWQLTLKANGSWKLADKTFFGAKVSGILKLPFKQPYFNQRLLGYNDFFMQGYEYYVVDGVAGGYVKASVSRELLNFYIHVRRKQSEELRQIPFRVYLKTYANAGYMHHPTPGANILNNRLLYSGGIGVDIITHYDFTLKLEWSFNQLGQNSLYLHRKTYF